jgi:uncharacterized protein YcgI (DUF1989 family)
MVNRQPSTIGFKPSTETAYPFQACATGRKILQWACDGPCLGGRQSANYRFLGKFILEDGMKIISESTIKNNTGKTFVVKKGQIISVIGQSTADYVVFNLRNVKERFDQARTKVDLEKGMCSTSFYKKWGDQIFEIYGGVWKKLGRQRGVAPKHGCWENLAKALKPHGVAKEDVPSPLNIFQTMVIDGKTGTMRYAMVRPDPGSQMDLRAEMDCLVGISACPEGGRGRDLRIVIYKD